MSDNKFLVPMAIIVAGAMIAGAIYLGGASSPSSSTGNTSPTTSPIDIASLSERDYIRGSSSAPIVLVEYSDIECPFCKVFHGTMKNIISSYEGRVAWVYRHYPIPQLHQKAIPEAIATECAAEQGGNTTFWNYLDTVFEATNSNDSLDLAQLPQIATGMGLDTEAFNSCLESGRYDEYISESMEDAANAGARGTPYSVLLLSNSLNTSQLNALSEVISTRGLSPNTIVISNDKKKVALGGALPLDLMRGILDAILE